MPRRRNRRLGLVLPLALALGTPAATGCSINPLTGKRELTLLSEEEERQLGRELDVSVLDSIGAYPSDPVQERVQALGSQIAKTSERPELDWKFRVLDDPAVNAFAVPGGYVYVTRGLLTHLDSDQQLAAVLSHEVGHVSARHSVNQLSRAAVVSTGAGLLTIVDPAGRHVGGAAQRGAQDFILRHSREDEIEADDLGVRYMQRVSLDPRAMYGVLDTVANATVAAGGANIPTRESTHPDPAMRRARLEARLGAAPKLEQDRAYLKSIDGMLFGQNALEGFMAGPRFVHPIFGIQVEFPIGWKVSHDRTSAATVSVDGEALVFMTPSEHKTADEAYEAFFASTQLPAGEPWKEELHGLPTRSSWFSLQGDQSKFVGIAAFVQDAARTFELFALVTVEKADEHGPAIEQSMSSFSPITSPNHRELEPMRIRIIELDRNTSIKTLMETRPSSVQLDTLTLINQVGPDDVLPKGSLVKWIDGFNPENLRPD